VLVQTGSVRAIRAETLIPGAFGAWLVTLVTATGGSFAVAVSRHSTSAGELAMLFPPLMSVPFALTTALVLLPIVALVLWRADGLWPVVAAAAAAAPLQVVALLIGGRILFRGVQHMRPTLLDDIVAVLGHPSAETLVLLGAFAAGGAVFGVIAGRGGAYSI
jgi:hypothetical protein